MSNRRHAEALDRLDAEATSAIDLFFGGAAVDEPPEPAVPAVEPADDPGTDTTPEAALAAPDPSPAPPKPPRRARRTASAPAATLPEAPDPGAAAGARSAPQEPGGEEGGGGGFIPVATGISPAAESALHTAAYAAGGEREKSRLVREAIAMLLADFDAADDTGRALLRDEMRRPPLEGRVTRIYRLPREVRDRLIAFGRDERIPMAAAVRAAVERRYGSPLPDEPAG